MKISEQVKKWNATVEIADWLTKYQWQQSTPQELFDALQAAHWLGAARSLRIAGEPLGYFRAFHYRSCGTHKGKACTCGKIQAKAHNALFPVDKVLAGTVKGKAVRTQQQRKAKK